MPARPDSTAATAACHTLSADFVVSVALSVLCLRLKITRIMPSHSVKFTGGGGFRSSIRTTRESTLGGGRKLLRFTCVFFFFVVEGEDRANKKDKTRFSKSGYGLIMAIFRNESFFTY